MNDKSFPHLALVGVTLALLALCAIAMLAMPAAGAPFYPHDLTPTAFSFLPYLSRQYPPVPSNTPAVSATPTSTPRPGAVAGLWRGTTDRGHPMSFTVSADASQWSSFTLKTDFEAPECGTTYGELEITVPGPGEIVNNRFSHSINGFSFGGDFSSTTQAGGTYAFEDHQVVIGLPYPPYVCFHYLTQSGTWTAGAP